MGYRKDNLPRYIEKLKSMVELNLKIMVKPIESEISKEKYFNIVKGRKMASLQVLSGLKQVDKSFKEIDNLDDGVLSSYYKENLPKIIKHFKDMFELNLEVIDIEIDEDLGEFISEEKLHNLVKTREMGSEDSDWVLTKIEELESELNSKEEVGNKVSFAKRSALKNKEILKGY